MAGATAAATEAIADDELDEGELDGEGGADVVTTGTEAIDQLGEAGGVDSDTDQPTPERVTPQLSTPDPIAREDTAPEVPAPVARPEEGEPEKPQ